MASERPQENLYEIFYKDKARLLSFYAQIFGGVPKEYKKHQATESGYDKGIKVPLGLLFAFSKEEKNLSGAYTLIDPAEIIFLDILNFLIENKKKAFTEAEENEIFLEYGEAFILDKDLIPVLLDNLAKFIFSLDPKALELQTKAEKKRVDKLFKEIARIFKQFPWETLVYFKTASGKVIVGHIKEEFLLDRVSALYTKFAGKAIPKVYLIGIKEQGSDSDFSSDFLSEIQNYLHSLSSSILPSDACTCTPLALFRKI